MYMYLPHGRKFHGNFSQCILIEVSRILEDSHAYNMACFLKFQTNGSPSHDLPIEVKKMNKKISKGNQGIRFLVQIQQGMTLQILNEIMGFKGDLFIKIQV